MSTYPVFAEVHWQGRFFVQRGWVLEDRGETVVVRRYRDDPHGDVVVPKSQLRPGLGYDYEDALQVPPATEVVEGEGMRR